MLLSLMRKQAQSWLIKVLIAVIAAVFVFYFGYSFQVKRSLRTACVNGELITSSEYHKAYYDLMERFRRQYKDIWNDDLAKKLGLKQMALDNLINQRLISQEAGKLGLEVTKKEIQQAIMEYAAFRVNGRFDMRRYRALLRTSRMKPEEFESVLAQELLEKKLRAFLLAFATVTDREILDQYTYDHEKIKTSFVLFSPDRFKPSVQPDEAGLKDFFEKHKEDYRVPEKIRLVYIEIDPKDLEKGIQIPDDDIKSYYEYNIDNYTVPEKVRARHILFKVDRNAPAEEVKKVKEKALSVLKKARDGADFAELAKKYSEGPTRSKGGDLGYFSKGQMVKPFEEAAFKMKPGQISDLVRTRFGFHIIKVEDIKKAHTQSLEAVRDQIRKTLLQNKSVDMAYEKGQTLIDQMPYDTELSKYAVAHGLKTRDTDYFSRDGKIPGIGGDAKLMQTLFGLEKGETSDLLELQGKYYIFQVTDRKPAYVPELKAVRDKVNADFMNNLAAGEAKSAAERFLAALKKGKAWDDLAGEQDLKTVETGFFSRGDTVPRVGYAPDLNEMLFSLNKDRIYPDTVYQNEKGAFVFRWDAYEGIDREKFQKEKEQQRRILTQRKHARIFEDMLAYLRSRADIEIITPP